MTEYSKEKSFKSIFAFCFWRQGNYSQEEAFFLNRGFYYTGYARNTYFLDLSGGKFSEVVESIKDRYYSFFVLAEAYMINSIKNLSKSEYESFCIQKGREYPDIFFPFQRNHTFERCAEDTTPSSFLFSGEEPLGWIIF